MPSQPSQPQSDLHERLRSAQQRRAQARAAGDVAAQILAAQDCGNAHFGLGETDLPFAKRLFAEAIHHIEQSGLHRELLPELLGMSGRSLQRMKRWDQVASWYRRAAEEAERQGLSDQQFRWRLKEAMSALDMNDIERGQTLLAQTIDRGRSMLAAGQPVQELLSDALQRLANLEPTKKEDATALWNEAEQLLEKLPASRAHYLAAVNRAAWHANQDQQVLAQTYLEEALEISGALGFVEQERVELGLRLATLLRKQHEPVQAGNRLLALLPQCRDDRNRHEVLTDAVNAYFAGHSWRLMRTAAEQLRELRRNSLGPGPQYDAAMRCSIACLESGDLEAALNLLGEALALAQTCENSEWITTARERTAVALLKGGRYAESVRLGEELRAAGVTNPLAGRTLVLALIGAGNLDRAASVFAELEHDGAEEAELAQLRAHLADAGRGHPRAAWSEVRRAAGRDARTQAKALARLLALTPSGKQRFEQAAHRLRLLDRARMQVNVFSNESWRATFENADELPNWLDEFVAEALAANQDEAGIYEMERFRAQTLVNVLAERRASWNTGEQGRTWFKAQMTSRLQRERYRFEALVARGASWRERRAAASEIERLDVLALSAGGIIHFAPNEQGIHFPENLTELLGDHRLATGECLLFAHALPDRLVMWSKFADGRIARMALPGLGRPVVDRMSQTLRAVGHDDARPDLGALLAQLDDICGRPLAAWLRKIRARRAFLSAGTALAGLPIDCCAAFLSPRAPELIFLPTAAALGFTRAWRVPKTKLFHVTEKERLQSAKESMEALRGRVLLVVDPSRDLNFAPLEGAAVASVYRKRGPELIDSPGIESGFLADACSRVDVLHFVGHGDFNDSNPYLSGVIIGPLASPNAFWTNGDIFSEVEAPAGRLAVLSGCETGQTLANLVSEEVSLPAAFIAAGYAAVVASRWAVDDLSTTLFMADFHKRWSNGKVSVAAALGASRRWLRKLRKKNAQTLLAKLGTTTASALPARAEECQRLGVEGLKLLEQENEFPFADPLYWAAFFVAGDGAIASDSADPRIPAPREPVIRRQVRRRSSARKESKTRQRSTPLFSAVKKKGK